MRWSLDEDRALLSMRHHGHSLAAISRATGRSIGSVSARLRSFGLQDTTAPRPRYSETENLQIMAMREGGFGWKQIARAIGRKVSGDAVRLHMEKHSHVPRYPQPTLQPVDSHIGRMRETG
jgi:hypothetical protein